MFQVSWIRKRDLHILTFGQLTYTNDARFSVIKSAAGDLWTLRIRSVQLRDAGLYECQVSSEPKISKAVRLKVVGKSLFFAQFSFTAALSGLASNFRNALTSGRIDQRIFSLYAPTARPPTFH